MKVGRGLVNQTFDSVTEPARFETDNRCSVTWFTTESATPPSRQPNTSAAPARQQHEMPQPRNAQKTYAEGNITLAIKVLTLKQI
jgi:hypothetical protein